LADGEIKVFQRLIEELTPKLSAYINSIWKKSKADKQPATSNLRLFLSGTTPESK
jgi:hypothetical protein